MRDPVPRFDDLGIVGVSFPGDPPLVAELVFGPFEAGPEEELTFCEGFAQGPDGTRYAWEIWTRPEWEAAGDDEPAAVPIARLVLLGPGEPPVEVFERPETPGFVWTQLVVPHATFTGALLERIRTGSDAERALCFTAVPPSDDDEDGEP